MVVRRLTKVQCLGLAWVTALGGPAVAVASPRNPAEVSISAAVTPLSAHMRGIRGANYLSIRNRPKARHRSGEHTVAQISPSILRRADLRLDEEAPLCSAKARRRSACAGAFWRQQDLPDILLEAPTPATERSLRKLGIPAIKDVPPIAILRARPTSEDYDFTAPWR